MMQIKQNNGKFLPFGTSVSLQNNDGGISAGLVGEAGEAYLSGLPAKGSLLAQWGKGVGESCTVNYQIPDSPAEIDIISLKEICEVH
ncbi:FimD/PapC C-terminal domain-containing protein [Lelliottia nimipressuralis]|jgi:outer membrane usher protein